MASRFKLVPVVLTAFALASGALAAEVPRVSAVQGEANVRAGAAIRDGAALRTGPKGVVDIPLAGGGLLRLHPNSTAVVEGTLRADGEPLLSVRVNSGRVSLRKTGDWVAALDSSAAAAIAAGPARYEMRRDAKSGLVTVAVTEGQVMLQSNSEAVRSINLGAGEQVSLNRQRMGPIVQAGAPPGFDKPPLDKQLLDLGPIDMCETGQTRICGGWRWNKAAQRYDATWENGAKAELKVLSMGGGEVVLLRTDRSGVSAGLTARYVGRNDGHKILGDVVITTMRGEVSWTAQGRTWRGTWEAESPWHMDLGAPPGQP